jgi:phage-related protein
LFGSDAIRGAAILANEGADGFNKMAKSMGKIGAEETAAKRMDNLAGDFEKLKGSAETIAIQMGTILIPVLRDLAQAFTGVLNKILEMDEDTISMIVKIAAAAAGLLILGGTAIKVGVMLLNIRDGFRAIRGAMSGLSFLKGGPLGLILVAIAALAAGLIYAYKHSKEFRKVVQALWEFLKGAFKAAWEVLEPVVAAFGEALKEVWKVLQEELFPVLQDVAKTVLEDLAPAFQDLWKELTGDEATSFKDAMKDIADFIINVMIPAWVSFAKFMLGTVYPAVAKVIGFLVSTIGPKVISTFTGLIQTVKGFFGIVSNAFGAFAAFFRGDWSDLWNHIKGVFSGIWNVIQGLFKMVFGVNMVDSARTAGNKIRSTIENHLNAIKRLFSLIWDGIKLYVSMRWNQMKTSAQAIWNAIKALFSSRLNEIKTTFSNVWNAIKNFFTERINSIRNTAQNVMNSIRSFISSNLNNIKSTWSSAWNAVKNKATEIWNGIRNAVSSGINSVVNKVREIKSRIVNFFSDARQWLVGAGRNLMEGLADGVRSAIGSVVAAAQAAANAVAPWFPGSPVKEGPLRSFNRGHAGAELMEMLADGIRRQAPDLERLLSASLTPVAGVAPSAAATIVNGAGGAAMVGGMTIQSMSVNIPAKDLAEMKGVTDFFDRLEQEARKKTGF